MSIDNSKKKIAILGGGPSGLFMYKRLVESNSDSLAIEIFERKGQLGAGMPYSVEGARQEHITNVSDNEIPRIVSHISEWVLTAPKDILEKFNITPANFNEYKVLPRLFFGEYLAAQFNLLKDRADEIGLETIIHLNTTIIDINYLPAENKVSVELADGNKHKFDYLVICTGHNWPKKFEGKINGYYDAPYPPEKIAVKLNHAIAIKGSSLTAIDAIRTLSRKNGDFVKNADGSLQYSLKKNSIGFKIVMHSRSGMLPAVRFHLENSHLANSSLLTSKQIADHRSNNNGYISLDYIFEKNFKEIFKEKDPAFYDKIVAMDLEAFVNFVMELRERLDPFQLLRAEYLEAEKSIKRKESVYWKEMLAILSFAMNHPAKYLLAEDMLRLQNTLMPLISIVIAFVPQSSCEELLALHKAGVLSIISVGSASEIQAEVMGGVTYHYIDENGTAQSVYYKTFIDCVGQPHLNFNQFPFKGLLNNGTISKARLKFKTAEQAKQLLAMGNKQIELSSSGEYYLNVPGIAINDNYNIVDNYGAYNERIFLMAVPYIGGYNPDYSGLDFCEAASSKIAACLV